MKKIDISTWKEYKYNDFFSLVPIKRKLAKIDLIENSTTPVYSAETKGRIGFTDQEADFIVDKEKPLYMTFGDHTKAMNLVMESFSVMDNVKVLLPKIDNLYCLLFIKTVWQKAIPDLGYARHWSAACKTKIVLPSTTDNKPDYEYMENYIKRKIEENKNKYNLLKSI